jgi:membrane associated rhomboid family serine protease
MTEPTDPPVAGEQETTTCYRHPGREAHIRCTRCNRRICPDCMIDASVGFQCPECVREGNKDVRHARTPFGGALSGKPGHVSKILIGINVAVFLVQLASSGFTARFELIGAFPPPPNQPFTGVADGEYYRLLTAAFMHGGYLHIAMNMYALYLFGPPLEAALGRLRFLTVFGLLGAFFVVNRRLGRETSGLLVLLAINFAFGFVAQGIDWRAHLGGLIAGGLTALAFAYAPPPRRTAFQVAGATVVLLAIIALVAWRTMQLT